MTTENNSSNLNNNGRQTHYRPPENNNYASSPDGSAFSWPDPEGTNNANSVGSDYILPPITPVSPEAMPYLTPPVLDPQAELYRQAARRTDAKLRFSKHLRIYVLVNLLLWSIAIISTTISSFAHHSSFWGSFWPLWVTIFWGVGLVSEYVNLFVMNEDCKQSMIEEEMRQMRR